MPQPTGDALVSALQTLYDAGVIEREYPHLSVLFKTEEGEGESGCEVLPSSPSSVTVSESIPASDVDTPSTPCYGSTDVSAEARQWLEGVARDGTGGW
ncbi:hypothetical protein KIPB_015823 [Kipferlia bialata]|uniref:Uncharacterized protein n=1 Tax=Kipferlia bialata TaxID=797122 RepID=A0A9K3GR86_9EUKA|nr:hypothetical protein KIPB_015823 [Kipferlia bialata]|eukprot:g15823.t1